MAPLLPVLAALLASSLPAALAYVLPDVSASTPAGCRCMFTAPNVRTAGSFLAGTVFGCGPHPDPTGTFAYPAQWCLVDQEPALLAAAGGSCGQKVAGLGNVSACSGVAFSGVAVAPSSPLAAAQPATTFFQGQPITVTWTTSRFPAEPGEGAYVALVSATGVVSRVGTSFVNATSGSFTGVLAAAAAALAQPVTVRVLQCKIPPALPTQCNPFQQLPNSSSTTVQPGVVGVSTQALSVLSLATVTDILDSRGISYTQPCVNFTSDNRTIAITVLANLQLQGNLFIGLAANGGGTAGGPVASVAFPAPPANTPTVVLLGTGAAGGLSGAYTINLRNATQTGALFFSSRALTFTKASSLAGVPPSGGVCGPSATPSATMAPSVSPTASTSFGSTASSTISVSLTGSISRTPTNSRTVSVSATPSVTPTASPTRSPGTASPSPTRAAPSDSSSFKPSPSASSSYGAANLGAGPSGAGAANAGSTSIGTIVAIVIGVGVVVSAIGYAIAQRNKGGVGGAAAPQWGPSGAGRSTRGFEAAPAVVVASNPLGGGGRTNRASFAPVGDIVPGATFIQCTDSSRGLTYYANATTGETVWTLPPGGVVTQQMTR